MDGLGVGEAHVARVGVRFEGLGEDTAKGYLARRVTGVENGVRDNTTHAQNRLWPNSPAQLPPRRIKQLAPRVHRHRPLPVISHRGKRRMLFPVKSEEIVDFVGYDDDVGKFSFDHFADSGHFVDGEDSTCWVVGRVEEEHFDGGVGELATEFVHGEFPVLGGVGVGEGDAEDLASSHFRMVQIHRKHRFKSNQRITRIQKRHDKRVKRSIRSLRHKHLFHRVQITSHNLVKIELAVGLCDLVDEDGVAKRPGVLIMPLSNRLHHPINKKLGRHEVRRALAQRSAPELIRQ